MRTVCLMTSERSRTCCVEEMLVLCCPTRSTVGVNHSVTHLVSCTAAVHCTVSTLHPSLHRHSLNTYHGIILCHTSHCHTVTLSHPPASLSSWGGTGNDSVRVPGQWAPRTGAGLGIIKISINCPAECQHWSHFVWEGQGRLVFVTLHTVHTENCTPPLYTSALPPSRPPQVWAELSVSSERQLSREVPTMSQSDLSYKHKGPGVKTCHCHSQTEQTLMEWDPFKLTWVTSQQANKGKCWIHFYCGGLTFILIGIWSVVTAKWWLGSNMW